MNNILFCKELITSGTLADTLDNAQLGFYDIDTLELTDDVVGKDFGIVGSTYGINGIPGVINIGDIHPLKVISSTLNLNMSYSIVIEAASSEEEETEEETEEVTPDTSDVEILVIHKNADTTRPWRHFITIPYADFNGDAETLMGLVNDKFEELVGLGQIEIAQSSYSTGTLTLYFSNEEQYEIKSKSSLISITGPTGYLPVTSNKIVKLIDKNIASFGIWHREEDDDWYKAVGAKVVDDEYDTIISIQYTNLRKAGVTHDGPILRTLHIITTSANSSAILNAIDPSQNTSGYTTEELNAVRGFLMRLSGNDYDNLVVRVNSEEDVVNDGVKYYCWHGWNGRSGLEQNSLYTTSLTDITNVYGDEFTILDFVTSIQSVDPIEYDPAFAAYIEELNGGSNNGGSDGK